MATTAAAAEITVQSTKFPAASKHASAIINGSLITANLMSFTDKLLLTLTGPSGSLAHWVHVPLSGVSADPMNPSFATTGGSSGAQEDYDGDGDGESNNNNNSLLPRTDLTATTVLGGTKRDEEIIGQTLATTLASAILVKSPQEERMLVLGLGFSGADVLKSGGFEEIVGLSLEVL